MNPSPLHSKTLCFNSFPSVAINFKLHFLFFGINPLSIYSLQSDLSIGTHSIEIKAYDNLNNKKIINGEFLIIE